MKFQEISKQIRNNFINHTFFKSTTSMEQKQPGQIPPALSIPSRAEIEAWIANDPSNYNGVFPDSPSATCSEDLWDNTILPQTVEADFGGSVTRCFTASETRSLKTRCVKVADTQRQTQV